jgi:hypothetical protein
MKSGKKSDLGFPVRVLSPKKKSPDSQICTACARQNYISCILWQTIIICFSATKCVHNVQKVEKKSGKGFEPQTSCTMNGVYKYTHAFRYTKRSCEGRLIPLICWASISLLILFSFPYACFRRLFFISNIIGPQLCHFISQNLIFSTENMYRCSVMFSH